MVFALSMLVDNNPIIVLVYVKGVVIYRSFLISAYLGLIRFRFKSLLVKNEPKIYLLYPWGCMCNLVKMSLMGENTNPSRFNSMITKLPESAVSLVSKLVY